MKKATLGQASQVLRLIEQKEIPLEQLQELLASGLLADLLDGNVREVNRGEFRKFIGLKPPTTFTLTVNYSRPLDDAIKALKLDFLEKNITEQNFPTTRNGEEEVTIELMSFDRRSIKTDEILKKIITKDFRPAELFELLVLGELHHEELKGSYPIAALGSPWTDQKGRCHCPALVWKKLLEHGVLSLPEERWLNLTSFYPTEWLGFWRFAAVRK